MSKIFLKSKDTTYSFKKNFIDKMAIRNYLLVHALFFDIIAVIVQAFVRSGLQASELKVTGIHRLLSKSHLNFEFNLVILEKILFWKMIFHVNEKMVVVSSKQGPIGDHRWPTCSGFIMNINTTCRENMPPFWYILSIHNVPIDLNNFFLWISNGRSPFSCKKCMMKRTSHLRENQIDAAIINSCYTNRFTKQITNANDEMFKVKICVANTLIKTFFLLS